MLKRYSAIALQRTLRPAEFSREAKSIIAFV
jgi:hypothetical protein